MPPLPPGAPRLLVRADAHAGMGLGHVMRSLALARYLAQRAMWRPVLATHGAPEGLEGLVASAFPEMPLEIIRLDYAEQVPRAAQGAAFCVLDGYHFSAGYARELRAASGRLALMDDFVKPLIADADVVINPAGGITEADYAAPAAAGVMEVAQGGLADLAALGSQAGSLASQQGQGAHGPSLPLKSPGHTQYCLGPNFALLRPPFDAPGPSAQAGAPEVFIGMGGADTANKTAAVVRALHAALPAGVRLVANTGPAAGGHGALAELDDLRDALAAEGRELEHLHAPPPSAYAAALRRAQVAVLTPSTSAYEAAACAVPLAVLPTADNQRRMAAYLSSAGLALVAESVEGLGSAVARLLAPSAEARGMALHQLMAFDGAYARRYTGVFTALYQR